MANRKQGDNGPMHHRRTHLAFWLASLLAAPLARGLVLELPPIGVAERSTVYEVTAGGKPMVAQRCDGREGPASYVHLIISEPTEFTVRCPQANGNWEFCAVRINEFLGGTNDSVRFKLDPGTKFLLRTGSDEKLFIFADKPADTEPQVGSPGVISIADRGVDGKGGELLTAQIQQAIDEVAARAGGGTLVFPPGLYRTGTIRMKSSVTLHLSAGARLQGSENPADYPFDPGTREQPDRTQDIRSRLILFDNVENAAITGLGEIDGSGQVIRVKHKRVPNLIRVRRSRNIHIEGVLLRRAAGWNTHVFHSDHVTIRNVKSISNWSDGVDPDNSRDVMIEDVLIDSYDDSLAIKSTGFDQHAESVRNITLRNAALCTVKSAAKIGTETLAKIMENITIQNVSIAGSRGGLVILLRDGALVRNVRYENVVISNSGQALEWNIAKRGGLGRIQDVVLTNIIVGGTSESALAGYDSEHAIENVRFVNFRRGDQVAATPEQAGLKTNNYVRDLKFEAGTASASQPE